MLGGLILWFVKHPSFDISIFWLFDERMRTHAVMPLPCEAKASVVVFYSFLNHYICMWYISLNLYVSLDWRDKDKTENPNPIFSVCGSEIEICKIESPWMKSMTSLCWVLVSRNASLAVFSPLMALRSFLSLSSQFFIS